MKKNNSKLYFMLAATILVFITMILLFILFYNANKSINEYHVDDSELYTYFGRQKITYNSKITLTRNNYVTEVNIDGNNTKLGSEPLYFKNSKKILLPNDMSVILPLENMKQKKLMHYSTIEYNNGSYLTKEEGSKNLSDSFLYDGNDLYVFLSETTLTFDSEKLELSPLSFVLCVYNDELYVYNYDEDKVYYYDLKEIKNNDVYVENDSYKVNINFDYIKFNNKSILLSKKIDNLDTLK